MVHDLSDDPEKGRKEPLVVQPDGSTRDLTESERYYQARTTPKPRKRYYFFEDNRNRRH